MKLIILSISKFREKEGIVNAISEEGNFTFRVHGLFNVKGKYASINNPLTEIDASLIDIKNNSGHKILDDFTLLYSPLMENYSYEDFLTINFFTEICKKALNEDEKYLVYNDLSNVKNILKDKIKSKLAILHFMAKIIKINGLSFSINECVRCSSKIDIVAFNFDEGGFICKKCFHEEDVNEFSIKEMRLIRNLFLLDKFVYKDYGLHNDDLNHLIKAFSNFLNDALGVHLSSIKEIINY